jgi:hypothetical protein
MGCLKLRPFLVQKLDGTWFSKWDVCSLSDFTVVYRSTDCYSYPGTMSVYQDSTLVRLPPPAVGSYFLSKDIRNSYVFGFRVKQVYAYERLEYH